MQYLDVCQKCENKLKQHLIIVKNDSLAVVEKGVYCGCGPNEDTFDTDIQCDNCDSWQCGFTMRRIVYTTQEAYELDGEKFNLFARSTKPSTATNK